jgi:iron complex outermembrane receptor protein
MRENRVADAGAMAAICAVAFLVLPGAWAQEPATPEPGTAEAAPDPLSTIPVAQDAAAAPEPGPRAATRIEDIVVTATKRDRSLREIPASISAIDGAALEDQGKLNLNDYIQQIPGVTASQGVQGYTRFTMRGISSDTQPTSPTPSPVGVFIGDTAFTDPYIANIVPDLSAFDLAGIQVMKGPQGTLFGGAALSGAVRFELQEPMLGQWQARGFSQLIMPTEGSRAWTSGAAVNVPLLTDQDLAMRLVYVDRNYSGVYDDSRSGEKDVDHGAGNQYRGILMWQPGNLKVKALHLQQDQASPNAINWSDFPEGPREIHDFVVPLPSRSKFSLDSLEGRYDFDSIRLVSLSSYLEKHSVFNLDASDALVGDPPDGYPPSLALLTLVDENSRAFSQELRLQSTGADAFQWLVGGYFYKYHLNFFIQIDTPADQMVVGPDTALATIARQLGLSSGPLLDGQTTLLYAISDATSSERAAFIDLSYKLWDHLDLSAGARAYWTRVYGGFVGTGLLLRAENNGMDSDSRSEISEHGISPKFSATYTYSRDLMLFAQAARGFRFGGIQYVPSTATNGVPPTFKSDTLWNYELGIRTSWLEHTLNADLTFYYDLYRNPIITQATQPIAINFQDNVSGAISRGLEASLLWYTPLDGLSLSLTGNLCDAHITTPFTAINGEVVQPGQEMPGAARTQYNATLQYLHPVSWFNVGANVGYTYVGKGYSDIIHSIEINGYGALGAGLVFSSDTLPLHPKLAINASNLLDVAKPSSGATGVALVNNQRWAWYNLIAPRTITARVSIEF